MIEEYVWLGSAEARKLDLGFCGREKWVLRCRVQIGGLSCGTRGPLSVIAGSIYVLISFYFMTHLLL